MKLQKVGELVSQDENESLIATELLSQAEITQEELEESLGRLATKTTIVL